MSRNWWIAIIVIILILSGVYFLTKNNLTSSLQTPQTHTKITTPSIEMPTSSQTIQNQESKIGIKDFAFNPSSLSVKVGTTVTWINNDSIPHTIVADKEEFTSSNLQTGDKFPFTFTEAGTFAYHCGIHSSMQGAITVIK